jgi:Holliday junction resolvase RusA-like endonuclease
MSNVTLTIMGCPKPQGRPRKSFMGGVFSPTTEHKERVVAAAHKLHLEGHYFEQPVEVIITYYFKRPNSHYGTGKNSGKLKSSAPEYHGKRPDLDNLNKAILDAIGDGNLWKDDSLVFSLRSSKWYSREGSKQWADIQIIEHSTEVAK